VERDWWAHVCTWPFHWLHFTYTQTEMALLHLVYVRPPPSPTLYYTSLPEMWVDVSFLENACIEKWYFVTWLHVWVFRSLTMSKLTWVEVVTFESCIQFILFIEFNVLWSKCGLICFISLSCRAREWLNDSLYNVTMSDILFSCFDRVDDEWGTFML